MVRVVELGGVLRGPLNRRPRRWSGEQALGGVNGGEARPGDAMAWHGGTGGASTVTAGGARARGRMGRVGRRSTGAGELRTGVNGGGVRVRLGTVVRSALRGGKRARTHACARPGASMAGRGTALGQCAGCARAGSLARLCGGWRRGPGLRGTASACARPGLAWRGATRQATRSCARAGRGGARELGKWGERARESGAVWQSCLN